MIQRFKIEDLILQDASGVVFKALDTQTGDPVALRRFFPFGPDGGGLNADEQAAYTIAIGRLAGLNHPALRSVVCGACDPVDSMPFIATQWIEGDTLESFITQGPLAPEAAARLITQALEVCELLSVVLAEEAVWVETDLRTIVVGSETSGRSFTFWISPLKWLAGKNANHGLEPIVTLTETVMGWSGRIVNDQAGRGLGAWLKWLRTTATTTTLREARESLAASVGMAPPPPADNLVVMASTPLKQSAQSGTPVRLAIVASLLAAALAGGWFLTRRKAMPEVPPPSPAVKPAGPAAKASQRAAELSRLAAKTEREKNAVITKQVAAVEARGGVISWKDHALLVQNNGKPVIVEGIVQEIHRRGGGKTIYFLFDDLENRDAARAGVRIGDEAPDAILRQLEPFRGKTVRISGSVALQTAFGLNRPDIMFDDVSAVRLAE